MASFCRNCGSPLGVNNAFCPQCGTQANQSPGQPPPPAMAAAPRAKGSSTALKIVVILLCVLFVGGAAVVGGMIYLAHRVKQAVVEKAAEQGVDLGSITSPLPRSGTANVRIPKPCEVLSKADVSQLIGEPIERTEIQDVTCLYYGPPGLSAKLAEEQASGTFKRAQSPGAHVNGTEVANSVDQLVNSLAAQAGQAANGGELPLLMLGIAGDGRAQMTALSATKAIFGGIGQAADAKGMGFGADIPGLGDKAIRVPKLGLNVLKGEIIIRVIPGPFPNSDEKTVAVARAVLPKI
jgi:hypothetical protein